MFSIKRGFPGPGFADYINVGSPVLLFDAEQLADIPVIGDGEVGDPVRIVVCFAHAFSITTGKDPVKGGVSDYKGKILELGNCPKKGGWLLLS